MRKLIATLAITSLSTAAGLALAGGGGSAELGLDPHRMFFRMWSPAGDSGDFQNLPNNIHDPIVLPCDVEQFGGQLDIDYSGAGPTVYPKLTVTLFDDKNQQITSKGCLGNTNVSSLVVPIGPITAGAVAPFGFIPVSSTN